MSIDLHALHFSLDEMSNLSLALKGYSQTMQKEADKQESEELKGICLNAVITARKLRRYIDGTVKRVQYMKENKDRYTAEQIEDEF